MAHSSVTVLCGFRPAGQHLESHLPRGTAGLGSGIRPHLCHAEWGESGGLHLLLPGHGERAGESERKKQSVQRVALTSPSSWDFLL